MQDKRSDTRLFIPEILSDLVILAETSVRRFIKKQIAQSKIASIHSAYERILDVDVTVKISNATDSEFDMDLQVSLTLPPFVNLDENALAEEAVNYAVEEVEKKYVELKRSRLTGSERGAKSSGKPRKNEP